MTAQPDPPDHGCTIDGQPAIPIPVADYNQLVADLAALRAVARGYCPDCGRGDAAPTVADWERERQRANHAETELAGVRALYERWIKAGPPPLGQPISRWWDRRLAELGAALRPEQQGIHRYLSTGCLHGDHAYCQNMTGLNGSKRPGECKFCRASCRCGCHAGEEQSGPAATQATQAPGWLLAEEARLAPSGIDTPGCDCGHNGMGASWHSDHCTWRRAVVDCPGRPTPSLAAHNDGPTVEECREADRAHWTTKYDRP